MFTEGIYPIGDGLLNVDDERLKGLRVADDINEIYDVEQVPFARGKFAAVRRAIHKHSGVHFAAKFLKRRRRAQSSDKEIKHEIAVLMLCKEADNIVKLNAVHESRSDTALLLELATGGELQTFLDNEECLNEAQARICMREVLKALQFLHKRSIVHLDLKPQNILLSGERIEDGLKLCDFGISRVVAEGTNVREIVGTPDYVAPEVLQYEPLSLMTDIWSVGVLAYVLLSGFSPFGGETKQETFLNISQCALTFPDKLFGGVSSAAIDFIRRALRIKPSDRMTAAGCLEHVWLKDECSIDRQIFDNLAKKMAIDVDKDTSDDELADQEPEESIDEDEDVEAAQDVSTEDNNITENKDDMPEATTSSKSESAITKAPTNQEEQPNGNGAGAKSIKKMTTTTAVLNMPATRATTVPLSSVHEQHLLIAARRHSSESNKENHFLSTKNIPSNSKAGPTALIIISPMGVEAVSNGSTSIAAISLPSADNNYNGKAAVTQCLFPDAPTTPKVIRKAPSAENSPTSVKALVRKFQLESGGNTGCIEKETIETTTHIDNVHKIKYHSGFTYYNSGRKSLPTVVNGKPIKSADQEEDTKTHQSSSSSAKNSSHCHSFNSNATTSNVSASRRASEPIASIHKKTTTTTAVGPSSSISYRSTCVLCLKCGGNTTTECRHSAIASTNINTDNIKHISSSSSRSNSCVSPSKSTTTSPFLLSSHEQLKHHHNPNTHPHPHTHAHAHSLSHSHHHHLKHQLRHHHAGKATAANNLSLDQGIIC